MNNLLPQVLVLNLQLLARGVSLIQSPCHLNQLLVSFNNEALSQFSIPLMVGPLPHSLIKSSPCFLKITLHASLVFLSLGLHLIESINVLSHLSHVVVMLLPEGSKSSLMSNVGLFKFTLQLSQLSLTLLVKLNLGGSVVARILKLLAKVFNVPGQQRPVLLSLCTVGALNHKLFIQFLKASLQFLDLPAVFSTQGLLILNLGRHGREFLLLALDRLGEFTLDALQVSNSLLG